MALERALFIVKPDAVKRNLIGRILAHVEEQGFRIAEARMALLRRDEAEEFYAEHRGKPFFEDLLAYITSGPLLLACLEREDAIARLSQVVGATDPAQAAPGTIRKLYGESKQMNAVHRSDGPASAEREIRLFFGAAAVAR